ncbi:hypothetical protein GEV33_015504 [Tenebrio molitor]|uniref:Uncharacterized protein n=1 Tax=Tenebrio molitor TaxID=7067 RepID=A0A8J6H3F0_TENMO|nr:hypothetical protein GEV33_015510 [Tenebrio molitor]KAH0807287.1 hypothetical protein GEV33_015504 [Tenebrio molitor]
MELHKVHPDLVVIPRGLVQLDKRHRDLDGTLRHNLPLEDFLELGKHHLELLSLDQHHLDLDDILHHNRPEDSPEAGKHHLEQHRLDLDNILHHNLPLGDSLELGKLQVERLSPDQHRQDLDGTRHHNLLLEDIPERDKLQALVLSQEPVDSQVVKDRKDQQLLSLERKDL